MISRFLYRSSDAEEYYFEEGCHILERLNDATDPALSIARARVAPGETTRWHRLLDTTERYLVVSGRGLAEVADSRFEVGPGDVVSIPPDTRQRITCTGDEELVFLALCTPRFRPECYRED